MMTQKLLNNLALILFAILIAALAFNLVAARNYKVSNRLVLEQAGFRAHVLDFADMNQWLHQEIPNPMILVDLREPEAFRAGHLEGAVNIPVDDVLKRKHRTTFEKKHPKLLIAEDEATAHAIRLILLGKGHENILVMAGSYHLLEQHVLQHFDPSWAFFREEKAAWDYPRFMPNTGTARQAKEKTPSIIPEMKTEVRTVQGGC
jgi:phage shock protein E